MTEEIPDGRPPAFPLALLNRPRPRGVVAAEKHVDAVAGAFAVDLLRDLVATLQQRMSAAVGLIDAGKIAEARVLLDRQVVALDALDLEPTKR
jgi:hypothetical protein